METFLSVNFLLSNGLNCQIEERSSQLVCNLRSCKRKPEKSSGLNGIRTHDLRDAGAMLCQLSYQANWELVII